ncbi:sigma-54 interaction domain-containing protein [Brenneria uluponensis]|uniref:sigma-54 interaction domain-containing protein n=1 Tax=Brenneria uluponensis TaxID=3057057 RepID=UPI0028E409FE|nr:sigma 54-interacting transcriptional regulator [Brenneria ulupoensis]
MNTIDCKTDIDINFKEILDHLECPICITDSNGVTKYINQAYIAENPMIEPERMIGRHIQEIVDEGNYFDKTIDLRVIQEHREILDLLNHHLMPDKNAFVSGRPIYDQQKSVKHVVSILYVDSFFQRLHTHFNYPLRPLSSFEGTVKTDAPKDPQLDTSIIGTNRAMQKIKAMIMKVAPADVPVLITGESGTGKEVIANAIQQNSTRVDKPFVKVNCAAIPNGLLESELFGYERGAFTGAAANGKIGLFEQANGGTIFLDEIGDLPFEAQSKFLRVLQQQEIQRVGGNKIIPLNVRIIAATNSDLEEKIQQKQFRSDLFYRLNVIPLWVPPLRQRPEDIPLLIDHFCHQFDVIYRRIVRFSNRSIAKLKAHVWQGNLRELKNLIEYLYVCSSENYIDETMLTEYLCQNFPAEPSLPLSSCVETSLHDFCLEQITDNMPLKTVVEDVERHLLRLALEQYKTTYKMAEKLGVAQPTIVRKLHLLGIVGNKK